MVALLERTRTRHLIDTLTNGHTCTRGGDDYGWQWNKFSESVVNSRSVGVSLVMSARERFSNYVVIDGNDDDDSS